MALVTVSDTTLTDIADAIRSKNGTENTYKPSEMPDAIEAISGGGITPTGTIEITQNGVVDVTNYASADVDVPQGITPTGTKQISITQNGTTTEDVTNYANAEITVNVSGGGTTPTATDALIATLESIGFTISEFDVASPDSGNYLTVPHSLGSVPTMIIAFNKDLVTQETWSGYQVGCCSGENAGSDNNNNRTYSVVTSSPSTAGSLFATVLAEATVMGFPIFGARLAYNFCGGATTSSVLLRNQNGNSTKMVGTKWILAVR